MQKYIKKISTNYILIGLILLSVTASALFLVSYARYLDFKGYHQAIALKSATSVAQEVNRVVAEKKRLVSLFSIEYYQLIKLLMSQPDNEHVYTQLAEAINKYFPTHFAFTLTSSLGEPLFEDYDGLVGDSCQADIKSYAGSRVYNPYIHPNPEGYHFDVMTSIGSGNEGVLFISFLADNLGAVLSNAQTPGHQLMLIYPQRENLIEVVTDGARNHWHRDDYRMTLAEQRKILQRISVNDTRWEAVDLYQHDLFSNFLFNLIMQSLIILFLVFLIGSVLLMYLFRSERNRVKVEQQKEGMVAIIGHELRTPASTIFGSLQLVSRGVTGEVADKTKNLIDIALNNSRRLIALINDLMDLQKLESGNFSINKSQQKLLPLVKDVIENNSVLAQNFDKEFILLSPADDAMVNIDQDRIGQVIINFLTNAIKYGAERDKVEIMVHGTGNMIEVRTTDHGPGIPEHFQPYVFDKYAMEKAMENKTLRSSGLGLYIAKAIIDAHQGEIGFNTKSQNGTTFYFSLPCIDPS